MKREDHRWAPAPAGLAVAPPMPRVAPARTRSRLDDRLARSTRGPKAPKPIALSPQRSERDKNEQ
jgi:hypothetical protein